MVNEAYNAFWFFINERHRIYLKKEAGEPKPWTDDYALQNYKFCNVFRKLDRQSQWLINNVIEPHSSEYEDASKLLFNIFAFRAFNWWPTYEVIGGWQSIWNKEEAYDILWATTTGKDKQQLTSGAYMIRGREGIPKYESIVMTLDDIWNKKESLLTNIYGEAIEPSIQGTCSEILNHKFWGWGPFTAYQIVLDLTYTPILANAEDINTWCEFGPGAQRGIREIYPNLKSNEMLQAAKGLLLDSPKFLEPHVPPLTLQDVEFCLCELQKYMRIKHGGRSKERYNGTT